MSKVPEEEMFGGIFDSFSNLVNNDDVAVLAPLDSTEVVMNKLINDHIFGLLSLDELSPQQVTLLAALIKARV